MHYVRVPLINPNEDTVTLIEWSREPRAPVRPGEVIAVVETSKASFEIEAEAAGFFVPLVEPGQPVRVGQVIAALATRADEEVRLPEPEETGTGEPEQAPDSGERPARRWTRKAEIVARRLGIDIAALAREHPEIALLSESDVEALGRTAGGAGTAVAAAAPARHLAAVRDVIDDVYRGRRPERVLVLGGGRGVVQVLDVIARSPHQRAVGILDDNEALHGKLMMGCPVLGRLADVRRLWEEGLFDAAIISIGQNLDFRAELYERCREQGIPFANVIDPTAAVLSNVEMGTGNVILAFTQIGACTVLGNNNLISSQGSIEHHNTLGSHCTFGPGVCTSGDVRIGDRVKFGTGVFVEPGIEIGSDSIIASGVVLTTHVPPRSLVKAVGNFRIRPR